MSKDNGKFNLQEPGNNFREQVQWQKELRRDLIKAKKEKQERVDRAREEERKRINYSRAHGIETSRRDRQRIDKEYQKNFRKAKHNLLRKSIQEGASASMVKGIVKPWSVWKYAGRGDNDGWYAVAFVFSVLGDVFTFIIGFTKMTVSGLLPGVGSAAVWAFDLIAKGMENGVVLVCAIFVGMAYLFAGHFKETKETRAHLRLLIMLGFDIMELVPMLNFLPGFTASFMLNYWLALNARAIEAERRKAQQRSQQRFRQIYHQISLRNKA